jgi:hypothetical protein
MEFRASWKSGILQDHGRQHGFARNWRNKLQSDDYIDAQMKLSNMRANAVADTNVTVHTPRDKLCRFFSTTVSLETQMQRM